MLSRPLPEQDVAHVAADGGFTHTQLACDARLRATPFAPVACEQFAHLCPTLLRFNLALAVVAPPPAGAFANLIEGKSPHKL